MGGNKSKAPAYAANPQQAMYMDQMDGKIDGKYGKQKIVVGGPGQGGYPPSGPGYGPGYGPGNGYPPSQPGYGYPDGYGHGYGPSNGPTYFEQKGKYYVPDDGSKQALDMMDGKMDGKYHGHKIKEKHYPTASGVLLSHMSDISLLCVCKCVLLPLAYCMVRIVPSSVPKPLLRQCGLFYGFPTTGGGQARSLCAGLCQIVVQESWRQWHGDNVSMPTGGGCIFTPPPPAPQRQTT